MPLFAYQEEDWIAVVVRTFEIIGREGRESDRRVEMFELRVALPELSGVVQSLRVDALLSVTSVRTSRELSWYALDGL